MTCEVTQVKRFLKRFGWVNAKDLSSDKNVSDRYIFFIHGFCGSVLKRLVESHELVIAHRLPEDDQDGLKGAKIYLEKHSSGELADEELERFKQAITDIETYQYN